MVDLLIDILFKIINIGTFLIILFIVIATHEVAHYKMMVKNGIKVKELCLFGMGPIIKSFTVNGVHAEKVSFRLLPIGAFVSMVDPEKEYDYTYSLPFSKAYRRLSLYIGAGPLINIWLACLSGFLPCLYYGNILMGLFMITLLLAITIEFELLTMIVFPISVIMGILLAYLAIVNSYDYNDESFKTFLHSAYDAVTGNGFISIMAITSFFSIVLAVVNCIPMLATDGGLLSSLVVHKVKYAAKLKKQYFVGNLLQLLYYVFSVIMIIYWGSIIFF